MRKHIIKKILRWVLYSILFFLVSTILTVLVYRFIPIPNTLFMHFRSQETNTIIQRKWIPIEQISPNMVQAVVASEDNLFLTHNGFDWDAISKAIHTNNKRGRQSFGASTISQQTAKNVFLWPSRSWIRKGLEVYFTSLIELCWSKERIMEVYLNVIELGKGIYGVEQASAIYFKKSASKLTPSESALLAVVLPNPIRLSVSNPSRYVKKRQAVILTRMNQIGPVIFSKEPNTSSRKFKKRK